MLSPELNPVTSLTLSPEWNPTTLPIPSPTYPTLATTTSIPMPTTSNPTDEDGIKRPIPIINQMIYYLYPSITDTIQTSKDADKFTYIVKTKQTSKEQSCPPNFPTMAGPEFPHYSYTHTSIEPSDSSSLNITQPPLTNHHFHQEIQVVSY